MLHRRYLMLLLPALLLPGSCHRNGAAHDPNTLSVAATAVPHAEILEFVKPVLAKQGLNLSIRVFNDYVQPNRQVAERNVDVNYFETKPYLDQFNAAHSTALVPIAGVHVEPLGGYSRKWKSAADLPAGATVAIPSEPSNGARALLLLQRAGLIRLRRPDDPLATVKDVTSNPKQLAFRELEAVTLPRVLDQVDLALINTNYALDAKLNPLRDALIIEDGDSPYVNFVVGLPGSANDPRVRKLIVALHSAQVRNFIQEKYHGAVLPSF